MFSKFFKNKEKPIEIPVVNNVENDIKINPENVENKTLESNQEKIIQNEPISEKLKFHLLKI